MKKYVAPTLPEAMAQVRQELGRDAIILHTHQVKQGGLWGLFAKRMIEVTAATDDAPSSRPETAFARSAPTVPLAAAAQPATAPSPLSALLAAERDKSDQAIARQQDLEALAGQIAEVKALVSQVVRQQSANDQLEKVAPPWQMMQKRLTETGLREDLAATVVAQASAACPEPDPDISKIEALVAAELEKLIGPAEPIDVGRGRQVIAFVGPTGVGKTTTLAKLAAHFALTQKKSVALVTADTYRIAAVEQLRTYGDIIGVPVDVIFTPQELRAALARHVDRDLVLIDTAGRSHKNAMQMSELRSLLDTAKPDETHLVLSSTTNLREAEQILEHFTITQYNRLLLTKLDENASPGQIANMAVAGGQPLSYVTTGQSVPDDLEAANAAKLASLILEG